MGVVLVPTAAALPFGAYIAGHMLPGGFETPVANVRRLSVSLWLGAAVFGGIRGYASLSDPDRRDWLLTTVSYRQLLAGVVLAELLVYGLPVITVATAAAVLFAAGIGSPIGAVAVLVASGLLLSTGFLTGVTVILLFKNGGVRSRLLKRLRTAMGVVVFGVYMVVVLTESVSAVLDPLYWLLMPTPIGWIGELVLVSGDVDVSPMRAGVAVVVGLVALAISVPVVLGLTAWLWYADGIETVATETASTDARWLSRYLPQPLVGVVLVDWTRGRRAPISLGYAVYPLFLLLTPIVETIETGTVGTLLPLAVAFCGAWITGALFTLNIIGNEGSVLPSTLLSPSPGRAIVGGHIAAGALLGVPIAGGVVAVLGVLSPFSWMFVATLTVGTLVVTTASGAIASGIGAALPRYEAVSVTRSRTAIVPSTFAFVSYSVAIVIVSFPLVGGHSRTLSNLIESTLGIPPLVVALTGVVVTATLAASFSLVSVIYAVRQVERHQFD